MNTRRIVTSIAWTAAFSIAAAGVAAQPPTPEFRLPDVARPTRYHLDLTIVPSEPTFAGSEVIDVALKRKTRVVWLNAKDLQIQRVSITMADRTSPAQWHLSGEFLAVDLPSSTDSGRLAITIRYTGALNDTATAGAYRRRSGADWYVYTSFTPIDARRAFPCFDEPGYKAPWNVVLHVKRNQVAVANAPAVSTQDEPDDMKRVVFAPTQPLASEVVAFAVGPFDVVDAGVAGQKRIRVRIIAPRGRGAEAAAARTATAPILARLEQYTGIPYPWDKLDHIALLDMPFGATENPGLITYRADLLLAVPDHDTQQRQQLMRSVMAHEMAHQWFGNLVTQAWWDDTWLSEGFATWLEAKVSDMERPVFERGLTITDTRDAMMLHDSLNTRPVRLEMHSRQETDDVYDNVIYSKGASILEMLEDWLGPAAFQRSLRRYLADHRFGNATSSDLVAAITQETGIDVGPVLVAFLDRSGAPVLHFSVTSTGGSTILAVDQSASPWAVPVCFHTANAERRCQVVSTAHAELPLSGQPGWIWPNGSGSGYYRSVLTRALLDRLVTDGYGELETTERLALAGDLEGLTSTGEMPAADAMTVLPRMMRDPEAMVRAHMEVLAMDLALVSPVGVRDPYAEWLQKMIGLPLAAPGQATSVQAFFRDKQ